MDAEQVTRLSPRWGEKAFTVFLLLALTKPFFVRPERGYTLGILEDGLSGNVYFAFVYGSVLVLLLQRAPQAWRIARADVLLWVLVALAPLSALWSYESYISLRGGAYLLASTLVGVYLAARYSKLEQVELAAGALAIAAVLSLLVGAAVPFYGVVEGNWIGVFSHKNNLGRFMALGTVTCSLVACRNGPGRGWALAGAGITVLLVILSGSSTALVVVALVAALALLYLALGAHLHLAVAISSLALLLAGAAVTLFLSSPGLALGALGRDTTLTGRTALWDAVGSFILQRPWLGYGYQAFWWGTYSTEDVKALAGWSSLSAHNGFLDLGLSIGLLGMGIFTLGFVLAFARAFRVLRRTPGGEGLWPIVFLSYFLLYNLTETSVLLSNNLLWVLYVATTLSLTRAASSLGGTVEYGHATNWRAAPGAAARRAAGVPGARREATRRNR